MRVLDSKAPEDAPVIAAAPPITASLTEAAAQVRADNSSALLASPSSLCVPCAALQRHSAVLRGLNALGVPYVENTRLVRGLVSAGEALTRVAPC